MYHWWLKLEKTLKEFDVSVSGKILLDIGASTGETLQMRPYKMELNKGLYSNGGITN